MSEVYYDLSANDFYQDLDVAYLLRFDISSLKTMYRDN